MSATMTALERLKRTLNFQETDEVVTGEIIQNGALINHFAKREVHNDWTMEEISAIRFSNHCFSVFPGL